MTRWVPVVALLLGAGPARVPPRLAVVGLQAPPSMAGLAALVEQQVARSAEAAGYRIIPPDAIQQALGQKPYQELQACNGNPACVALGLARLPATRAVVGSLGRDEKSYLVRLWLVSLPDRAVVSSVDRAILIASRRFTQDVARAIPDLLEGRQEAQGRLVVTASVDGATVTVDGVPAGLTPLTLTLKPGKYELGLEKPCYLGVRRFVDVEAHTTTKEELRLLRRPEAAPEAPTAPAPAPPPPAVARREAGTTLRVPVGGWVALGASAAAAGVGIFFGARSRALEGALLRGYDPTTGVYQGRRVDALAARQDAQVANYCFGAAGVALVTAAVFTYAASTSPEAPAVALSASGSGAALWVKGRF